MENRKIGPVYLFWEGEFLLNSPLKDAWSHVLNYPSWQNFPVVEHVSGTRGQEGEVVRLRKEEGGFSSPPYYARTIKLEPEKKVIWKVYFDQGSFDFDLFGIVDFRVSETDNPNVARFEYRLLYEFMVPFEREADLDRFRSQQQSTFDAVFSATWPKLKELVEKRS